MAHDEDLRCGAGAQHHEEQGGPALEAEGRGVDHGVADGAATGPGCAPPHEGAADDRAHRGLGVRDADLECIGCFRRDEGADEQVGQPRLRRGQGDGGERAQRGGAQGARGIHGARVQHLPQRAHLAHHHREVEEHHRENDRRCRLVQTQELQRAAGAEQGTESHPHHHGGQYERDGGDSAQHRLTGEPAAVEDVGAGDAQQHRARSASNRHEQGVPDDPPAARTAQHLGEPGEVDPVLAEEPAGQHGSDGPGEEHGKERQRECSRQRPCEGPADAVQGQDS